MSRDLTEAEFDELLKKNCRNAPHVGLLVTALRRAAMDGLVGVRERLYEADGEARAAILLDSRTICSIDPKPTKSKVAMQIKGSDVASLDGG